jgi:hypothetical protein
MDQQNIFASVGPAANDDRISGFASARKLVSIILGCSTSTDRQDEVAIAMNKVTVYRFQIWDQDIGENVWAPRMATVGAIQRVNGAVDEATAQLVDRSALDDNGFYPAKPLR